MNLFYKYTLTVYGGEKFGYNKEEYLVTRLLGLDIYKQKVKE